MVHHKEAHDAREAKSNANALAKKTATTIPTKQRMKTYGSPELLMAMVPPVLGDVTSPAFFSTAHSVLLHTGQPPSIDQQ